MKWKNMMGAAVAVAAIMAAGRSYALAAAFPGYEEDFKAAGADSSFILTYVKDYSSDSEEYAGICAANGTLGLLPWNGPFAVRHVMLNNVFERSGEDMVATAVRGICPFGLSMHVDGKEIGDADVRGLRQEIDMKRAEHVTEFEVPGKVAVRYSFIALRNLPHALLMTCEIMAEDETDVTFVNRMAVPDEYVSPLSFCRSFMAESRQIDALCTGAETLHGSHSVAAAAMFMHDGTFVRSRSGAEDVISRKMKKGENASFTLAGTICSTADFSDPYNEALRQIVYIDRMTPDRLIDGHRRLWEELWKGDIEIEGDEEAQKAVRLALYSLYSFGREGTGLSIPPMGLSSRGYGGHIFWDSELWMFPPMLMLNSGIAGSMMEYRFDRLDKAIGRASAYGYRGAMFPWESDGAGEEATPVWAITGPMEHHITADVAIAAWNYFCVTQDREWLEEKGWPLISAAAEFWADRASCNGDGTWSIHGVTGADEYANNVTDNAFTNGAAKMALGCAVKAAKKCGRTCPSEWAEIADGLRILRNSDGVTMEYDGYDGEMIKQADVNLLAWPLGVIMDKRQMLRDLEYYEDRIDPVNGPAMSFSIFCIQYARLGNADKAYEMFRKCWQPFVREPFGAFAETSVSDNPYFATGAGGLLQAVLSGFGGLEITEKGIVQRRSVLPPSWTRLTIRGVGPDRRTYTVFQD